MDTVAASPRRTVSEHDREHFRNIGRWKHEMHEQARLEQLARGGRERILYSLAMTLSGPYFDRDARDDDPSPLYERARRLGLYSR